MALKGKEESKEMNIQVVARQSRLTGAWSEEEEEEQLAGQVGGHSTAQHQHLDTTLVTVTVTGQNHLPTLHN